MYLYLMGRPKNIHEQIYNYLKSSIASGEFKRGELLPTDNEVAAKFQASRPTVAKAVSRLVKEGVLGRRPGYGTFILDNSDQTLALGLLIPGLGDTEIFEPICAQIASLAVENNFNLIWGGGGGIADKNRREAEQLAQHFVEQKIDGVFFTPVELIENASKINRRILSLLKDAHIPVVLLDADVVDYPSTSKYDLIGIDNIEAGYTVTSHLIEQGCRSIGFVVRNYVARTVAQRLMGARSAAEQAGLGPDAFSVLEITGEGEELAARLAGGNAPDGIVCYNDVTASLLMKALFESGVSIPSDVRLVGIDDVKFASMLRIPLTTYRQPCVDIGTAAVHAMLSRIENPKLAAMRTLLKGELIVRQSSGAPQHIPVQMDEQGAQMETHSGEF